jgi:pimeloyl-ACP methyl ester carboxylesterase
MGTRHTTTAFGDIGYRERGAGEAALFVHGIFLNGHLWRHVVDGVADLRRCIAIDLMAHGATPAGPGQELTMTAQAEMIAAFLDAMGIDRVDLVGNDSGGAIAQIFAARNPERVRTLTLTNCDVHDRWPPPAFLPLLERARDRGWLERWIRGQLTGLELARSRRGLGAGYTRPERLDAETVRAYLEPFLASPVALDDLQRCLYDMRPAQTVAVEAGLRALRAPTLIVWALDDVYFDIELARWLRDAIPGTTGLIELPGARLFFPDDAPELLIPPLRAHWAEAAT